MKVTKKQLQEMIREALREQSPASSGAVTMHSVAPPSEPEKLFPTGDADMIRKWMKQLNDIRNEMRDLKFHSFRDVRFVPTVGRMNLSPVTGNVNTLLDALFKGLQQELSAAKAKQNQKQLRKKTRI